MASKKKCFIGPAFDSLDVLLDWIDSDFWIFIRSRAFHPSFVRNRMLWMVRKEWRNGTIRACYDVNGEPYITDRLVLDDETENLLEATTRRVSYGIDKQFASGKYPELLLAECSALNHKFSRDAKAGDLCICGKTVYTEFGWRGI